ncbi:metal-dependent hydrolase [Candidatus Woesearchaeota archaeon]|nr:metal-dependent hydrolase [Candidatus Woesearchaeota archaeon]
MSCTIQQNNLYNSIKPIKSMPLAVTHIIITIVLVDLYRHYIAKNSFSRVYVLIAGIAGLLPDADIPLSWLISLFSKTPLIVHRIFTHAVIWSILFVLIAFIIHISSKKKYFKFTKKQVALFFIMISIGWLSHIVLDCTLQGNETISWIPIIANLNFCPKWLTQEAITGLDAIILLAWLIHEEIKHKIKDYF